MRPRLINIILILTGILLWLGLLGIHVFQQYFAVFPDSAPRELILGGTNYLIVLGAFMLVHMVLIGRLFGHIEKLNVPNLMWRLFMIGMIGIALIMIITFADRATYGMVVHRYLSHLYYLMGLYALLVFFLSATYLFKRFILYPRTKRKILLWRLFLVFLMMGMLMQLGVVDRLFGENAEIVKIASNIPLLIVSIILSTNVRWIAYLNFNQKLRVLGLFALLALVITTYLIAAVRLPDTLNIEFQQEWNPYFILYLVIFTISYTLFSILVLFFNLPTTSIFERDQVEIASYNKINQAIQSNLDYSEIIRTLLDASVMASNATGGWVEMINEETGTEEVFASHKVPQQEISALQQQQHLTRKVLEERQYFLVRNMQRHKAFREISNRYKCLLVVPILSNNQNYGAVYVVNELSNSFEDVTVDALGSFAEQAGMALENARLIKNSIELERYQEQLKIAKEVQSQLLPQELPFAEDIEFVAKSETAQEVGGDYFDVFQSDDHTYQVAIGDVSGKGTTAAFYMAEIKGIFHALTRLNLSSRDFITTANHALSACMQPGFFMTLTFLQIDTKERTAEWIRAGHCPAMHYQPGCQSVKMMREGTLGLGIVRNGSFEKYVKEPVLTKFNPGDFLVLYTDGIIEARNEDGEEYGYGRLEKIIEQLHRTSVNDMAEGIVNSVKAFTHSDLEDDYTVLIIRFP